MKATFNSPRKWLMVWGAAAVCLLLGCSAAVVFADSLDNSPLAAYARSRLLEARRQYEADAENPTNAAQLACTCYDAANFATNRAEHARLAREGIAICRQAIASHPEYAPAHYYLAMNLGQLAHTEIFSALTLVREMEREFKTSATLDPMLDYAGPERNLGLLYLQAPRITSIGNHLKAREFLETAAKMAPDYPENHLNLAEMYLKWEEFAPARREMAMLAAGWPAAKARLTGEAWADSWDDWTTRRAAAEQALAKLAPKQGEETP
jgi:tetratricopeptide (TPR) repeat protein